MFIARLSMDLKLWLSTNVLESNKFWILFFIVSYLQFIGLHYVCIKKNCKKQHFLRNVIKIILFFQNTFLQYPILAKFWKKIVDYVSMIIGQKVTFTEKRLILLYYIPSIWNLTSRQHHWIPLMTMMIHLMAGVKWS